ncbi:unnamed protein product [Oikopleura dioica]|nr:unnamed protein product [Oikopleura dioica]
MVPPSMVAACCITAAVCGNEKFSANTPEGILGKMQVGIAVETDFLKSCYSTVADCLKSALFAESDSGDSGMNSGDSSMSSETSSNSIERVTPDEVDENV